MAVQLKDAGKLEEAEALATEALNVYGKTLDKDHFRLVQPLALLGDVMIRRGEWREASALLEQAVKSSPSNSVYQNLLGDLEARRGGWPAAVKHFSRAVELDPTEESLSFNLAIVLMETKQYEEYRRHCHRYLARAAFAEGEDLVKRAQQQSSGDLGNEWRDWTIANLLRREAEALLDDGSKSKRASQ